MNKLEKIYHRLTSWMVPKSYKEEGWVILRYAEFLHDNSVAYNAGNCKGEFETCPDKSCVDARNHRQWLKERYLWTTPSLSMSSRISMFGNSSKRKLRNVFSKVN